MNYIGSKYSLLDFYMRLLQRLGIKTEIICFKRSICRTGVVGASYKSLVCSVISNDIQYYSYSTHALYRE